MSQLTRICAYLAAGHALTPLIALERFGCLRLAARIAELREIGHPITTRIVKLGSKRFASYRLG